MIEQCVGKISIKKNMNIASLTSKYSQMFYNDNIKEVNSYKSQKGKTWLALYNGCATGGTKTRPSMARPSVEQMLMLNKEASIVS